ncbi:uncharacterized protein LOC128557447 [Mercenaria mercenaria]|uniref:uncharacterized protein LOC128557447 n=1 Tax=Mercenaria mercenaria TaxID=6596 RepID=UPI00234E6E7E|nr:uncharacterized protein LOC128557447 [Mercenaria mercenaria]
MNLFLLLCLGLLFPCTLQKALDEDTLSHILTELKNLQEAQKECTNTVSELKEYKSRVLSLENTVKDFQNTVKELKDTVKDLKHENNKLFSEIHRLKDDRMQNTNRNVNKYESKTEGAAVGLPRVVREEVLNATYPLLIKVIEGTTRKQDNERTRSAFKRSFTMRPTPTYPGQTANTHVAFTVGLSQSEVTLGDHSIVIFDNVFTNIGSAYQKNTGILIAPIKGAYVFSLTMAVSPGQHLYLEIVKDGRFVNSIYADSRSMNNYSSTTKEWILEVNKGSEVWIRCGTRGELHGNLHSMLSGYLLFETN